MNKIFFTLFFLFCAISCLKAQKSLITGTVKEQGNEVPIVSANVILTDKNNKIIAYAYTDELGYYSFKTEKIGEFNLQVNSIGFERKNIDISIKKQGDFRFDFELVQKAISLKEVVIAVERPIEIKKDTIIFDVKYFSQGNEQVVEDLLKKIPGLNVDDDGTIKVGHQEVEKVMIEGDDFFEKGYRLLTKNMPSNPIEKVELYHNFSNNKHLKGIENSNKVALNLKLKEDAKNEWFGEVLLGYGVVSENRYETKKNLMNFGKKYKHYFLTSLNNIGESPSGDINHLIWSETFEEVGQIGNNQFATSFIEFYPDLPNFKHKRVTFNNAEMVSLNTIINLSTKVKTKVLGFLNTDETDFFRNSIEQFSVDNLSFENSENYQLRKKQKVGFGKLDFTYDISTNKTFQYSIKFNHTNDRDKADLVFNSDLLNENLSSKNQLIDNKILFTNKLKNDKVLLIAGRYTDEKKPQTYSVNRFFLDDFFSENITHTKQYSENRVQFAGIECLFLHKNKKENLFEIKIGDQMQKNVLVSHLELFDDFDLVKLPTEFQNNLKYITNDLSLSAKYNFNFKKYTITAQTEAHQLLNKIDTATQTEQQSMFFIVPKISLNWKINDSNKMAVSYAYNTKNAELSDVYNNFIQTGFNSFYRGLGTFNQLNSSNVTLGYNYANWKRNFFVNTLILYFKNNDFYGYNSVISQKYTLSEKMTLKDRDWLSASSNVDYYIKALYSNLKLSASLTKFDIKNIINHSELRNSKNTNITYGIELRSGFDHFFNYHIGTKWDFFEVKNTTKKTFTNNTSFLDLSFIFSNRLSVNLESELYHFGSLKSKYYFLDLQAQYVFKPNKLTFFLSANNLFNTREFNRFTISDTYISQQEYKLLPRYVLLKLKYQF